MLYIDFGGWWQMRMALDPDPNDEPRGVSGPTVALPGEPDFDGVIRFQGPVDPRWPRDPADGVRVKSVAVDDAAAPNGKRVLSGHPLLGASVDLLDSPTFAERGFVVLYQKMPVDPFHLRIESGDVSLEVRDLWDPTRPEVTIDEVAALDPALLVRRCVSVQPQSPLVAGVTGVVDYAEHRRRRRRDLENLLRDAVDPMSRAGLEMRIDMLAKDELVSGNDGMVALLLEAQQFLGLCGFYSFVIQGAPIVSDPHVRLGGLIGTSQQWQVAFWMGGYERRHAVRLHQGHIDSALLRGCTTPLEARGHSARERSAHLHRQCWGNHCRHAPRDRPFGTGQ